MANIPQDAALEGFAREVNRPDADINLARAALVMVKFEYPHLDEQQYMDRIDHLAAAADRAASASDADAAAVAIAQFLFTTLGFTGNAQNYPDPRNSFLNEVIERRLGIPISLSVLYLEVARRVGIQAEGVGLPGHFIVRVVLSVQDGQERVIYLDPFHQGAELTEEDCRARVHTITDGKLPFDEAFLDPVSNHYILVRMLNNLKNSYSAASDFSRALKVVERLLVLSPNDIGEIRNLGLLHGAVGKKRSAVVLLEQYLAARPNAPDAEAIRQHIRSLSQDVSRWN
jgi:regulator of sirC expression with transglutaminase-like and TPR domain